MRHTLLLAFALAACGSTSSPPPPRSALVTARPFMEYIPKRYDGTRAFPLVVLLHGYSASAFLQEIYFNLSGSADTRDFLLAFPDGTVDSAGKEFWNATDACCNYDNSPVDDVAYLDAVIDDMQARYHVDARRVYFVGHSNGGFMSYRMACEAGARIAGLVSLAGAMWKDVARCPAASPVAVLQVHGDMDPEVLYDGTVDYPSAKTTVADWASINGCSPTLSDTGQRLDLVPPLPGAETTVARHDGCASGAAELWTIVGGIHIPNLMQPTWGDAISDWLLQFAKP